MAIVLPYPSLGTGVVDPSKLEANFSELASKFGAITTSDLAASAGIANSQLAAQYQWMAIPLFCTSMTATGVGSSSMVPIYNDGKGAWTVAAINYITPDVGTKTCEARIDLGYWNGTTWTAFDNSTATVITATNNNDGAQGSLSTTGMTTITGSSSPIYALAINITVADAAAGGSLFATVQLKRSITT